MTFITNWGEEGCWYTGVDERGVELEIGTVRRGADELVVHAMPTVHRHRDKK